MTDYTDYESYLEDALFDALAVLRKEDLTEAGDRLKLYAALDRIKRNESAYREYWQE